MTLAIIAGSGDLPKMIIKKCQETKRPFSLILVKGQQKEEDDYSKIKHDIIHIGHASKALEIMRQNKATQLVFAGGINKPSMANLKVDKKGAILASKLLAAKLFGDDNVLSTVIKFFEKEGFKVIGADEIIDDLLAPRGVIGKVKPTKEFLTDIEIGKKAIETISCLDVGQSVVTQQKQIIGIEAVEGTDNLIKRCGSLKSENGHKPTLIKIKKTGQNTKVDLPTFGVSTIENLHKNGYAGIATHAGSSLIINKKEVVKLADKYNLFIVGI